MKVVTDKTSFFVIRPYILYGNVVFLILVLSIKKTVLQFFEKGFRFLEIFVQTENIEKVQNFL